MDDAFFVGGVEGIGELNADLHRAIDRQPTGCKHFVQRIADKEFHGDEGAAVVLFDGVDGADRGVV